MSVDEIVAIVKRMPAGKRELLLRRLGVLQGRRKAREPKPPRPTKEQIRRGYEKLFELAGVIKGGPSDVSTNKYKYIADSVDRRDRKDR